MSNSDTGTEPVPTQDTTTDNKIQVETKPEKPGKVLVIANIGPAMDVYAIYVEEVRRHVYLADGTQRIGVDTLFHYYVEDVLVSREVYKDCMETADRDRFCPGCMGEPDEATKPHDCELS